MIYKNHSYKTILGQTGVNLTCVPSGGIIWSNIYYLWNTLRGIHALQT